MVRNRFISSALGIVVLGMLFDFCSGHTGVRMTVDLVIAGIGGLAATVFLSKRNTIKWAYKSGLIGEHCIELSAEGVREKTNVSDSLLSWKSITRIVADQNYICFCLSFGVFGIPKRSFSSEKERDSFLQMTRSYWKAQK